MDPKMMRVSDAERTAAAEQLAVHYSAGRLTSSEYDERCQQSYAAATMGDLDAVFSDLPALPRGSAVAASPLPFSLPVNPSQAMDSSAYLPAVAPSSALNRVPGKALATRKRDTRRVRTTAFLISLFVVMAMVSDGAPQFMVMLIPALAVLAYVPNWDGVRKPHELEQ